MAVLCVVQPFAYNEGNVPRVLRAGDLVDETDPCVKGRPAWWFEPVEATAGRKRGVFDAPVVEQATAAPGEKRTASKPKAKAADAG